MIQHPLIKRPMLAGTPKDLSKIKFPVLASPKLDGFRCVKVIGKALSRSFKPIANTFVREYIECNFPENIDGELMLADSKATFNDISSAFRKHDGKPDFIFFAFDFITEAPFHERVELLNEVVAKAADPRLIALPQSLVYTLDELLKFEELCLKTGYEGVMVRSINGPYKEGRSTEKEGYLLKLKRFEDSEAEIIGFEEQLHNENEKVVNELGKSSRSSHKENMVPAGTLGKFLVRDIHTGVEFKVGTGDGLTQHIRQDVWDNREAFLGTLVKYKFQPVGTKEKPRIPIWLGFRAKEDL